MPGPRSTGIRLPSASHLQPPTFGRRRAPRRLPAPLRRCERSAAPLSGRGLGPGGRALDAPWAACPCASRLLCSLPGTCAQYAAVFALSFVLFLYRRASSSSVARCACRYGGRCAEIPLVGLMGSRSAACSRPTYIRTYIDIYTCNRLAEVVEQRHSRAVGFIGLLSLLAMHSFGILRTSYTLSFVRLRQPVPPYVGTCVVCLFKSPTYIENSNYK